VIFPQTGACPGTPICGACPGKRRDPSAAGCAAYEKARIIPQDVARLASGHSRTGSADRASGTSSGRRRRHPYPWRATILPPATPSSRSAQGGLRTAQPHLIRSCRISKSERKRTGSGFSPLHASRPIPGETCPGRNESKPAKVTSFASPDMVHWLKSLTAPQFPPEIEATAPEVLLAWPGVCRNTLSSRHSRESWNPEVVVKTGFRIKPGMTIAEETEVFRQPPRGVSRSIGWCSRAWSRYEPGFRPAPG